jgi:hypothetical protein
MQFMDVSLLFCRASAIFVGIYEPTKQKLLKSLPENLSALAQLVRCLPNALQVGKLILMKNAI